MGENCVLDCKLGEWGPWGACSKTCGKGTKIRTKKILQYVANGGEACGEMSETECCGNTTCPAEAEKVEEPKEEKKVEKKEELAKEPAEEKKEEIKEAIAEKKEELAKEAVAEKKKEAKEESVEEKKEEIKEAIEEKKEEL